MNSEAKAMVRASDHKGEYGCMGWGGLCGNEGRGQLAMKEGGP